MPTEIQQTWQQLQEQMSIDQFSISLPLGLYLAIGGVLALYLRFLYNRYSASVSGPDSFSRVFPLLTMATIAVIVVVKSSVALSLGLVGALSIVRFRAAIKDPEELVYLFLSIAVGLALGAEQPLLAIVLVVVATIFVIGMHLLGNKKRKHNLMLMVTGDTDTYFSKPDSGVFQAIEDVFGISTLQRLDINNGKSQVRFTVKPTNVAAIPSIISQLKERLPECEFSYVNIASSL